MRPLYFATEITVVQVRLTDDQVTFVATAGGLVLFLLAAVVFSQFKKPGG